MPSEFQLIEAFLSAFPRQRSPFGPGDDCAVVKRQQGEECVTTDALVEGVHFTRRHFTLEEVGHKALAVNLSDLASMGARPSWFVCALAWPRGTRLAEVQRLAWGMSELARSSSIRLVGGNFTSASELSVTITAAGFCPRKPLLRSGARAGDFLYVSGTLGEARLALSLLGRRGAPPSLLARQKQPTPRIELGRLAARFASGCIDLSDGLSQDLGHLCQASGVGAEVEVDLLPVSAELVRAAGGEVEARRLALAGGEDYELLVSVPPSRALAFEAAARRLVPVTRIGLLTRERALRLRAHGKRVAAPRGFDHFR